MFKNFVDPVWVTHNWLFRVWAFGYVALWLRIGCSKRVIYCLAPPTTPHKNDPRNNCTLLGRRRRRRSSLGARPPPTYCHQGKFRISSLNRTGRAVAYICAYYGKCFPPLYSNCWLACYFFWHRSTARTVRIADSFWNMFETCIVLPKWLTNYCLCKNSVRYQSRNI